MERLHHAASEPGKTRANRGAAVSYVTVKMLDDVPDFIGSDLMPYSLRKDEVARVPDDTADVLYKRGKAIRFD